ncbi:MAG: 1,4-dihydroxy-2-naphthoate octaprenyltransferase [Candidatus Bathyarchaeia archaeon]
MRQLHTKEEILSVMDVVDCASVATASGVDIRSRMMHYWNDEDFNVYLATMKGDPKTLQITENPSVSLLILKREEDMNDSSEVEVTGRAFFVKNEGEKDGAFRALAGKSPVVRYLRDTDSLDVLDCIKVVPVLLKYRIFREIVQGLPPTVIGFPENQGKVSEFHQLGRKLRHWGMELRSSFLTAAIVSIVLGTSIAWARNGAFDLGYFLLTLIGGVFLHAGTNVINDYFDHKSGNDEVNREFVRPFSGGSRMIQLGLLTPLEVLSGALLLYAIGVSIGLYLTWKLGLIVLLLGLIGVFSGFFYMAPPLNWASKGVGEALVGINFGGLMTLGAYYVQTGMLAVEPLAASIPVSLLIAAVLYINEFPDYGADRAVGKDTLVVRLGRGRAVYGYMVMMLGAYGSLALGVLSGILPVSTLIGFVTLPLAVKAIKHALKHHSSSFDLVPANVSTIVCHLVTSLLLSLGYLIEGFGAENLGYIGSIGGAYALFTAYVYRHIERQKNIFLGLKKTLQT